MQNSNSMDEVRTSARTKPMPLSGGSYPATGVNSLDTCPFRKNILAGNSSWMSMSNDIDSPAAEVTQCESGTSPSFNAIAPQEPDFHQKLMITSERMERMQEKMDDLELKFQEITKYLQENPPSPENEVMQPEIKEWHKQINQELRVHLVRKIMSAILIVPPSCTVEERILKKLEDYCKKVENDVYEAANSKSEYYHMLALKYYEIMKEIDRRRQKLAKRF